MNAPAGRTRQRWRRLTMELDQLRQPVLVIGNWRTGPGTILHINPAWLGASGFTASETLGQPAPDHLLAPENEPEAFRRLRAAVGEGGAQMAELLRARKGRRPTPVRLRAWALKLVPDGQDYLVIAERPNPATRGAAQPAAGGVSGKLLSFERPNGHNGRTENQRRAAELIDAQLRFQNSLENCAFGVERIDATGRILYANPIYHELLGFDENALIGENVYQRLQDPLQARAYENYVRHLIAMEPAVTPIFTTYRRKDGTPVRVRLDWSYDRSASGVATGLISIVTPVAGGTQGEPQRDAAAAGTAADTGGGARRPAGTEDAYSRLRLLQQTLHAARVWASILAHRHPEGDDSKIVAKVDNAIDEALRMLGSERRPPVAAASYYEEAAPLRGLVVAVVEPVQILRASIVDLLRSWHCNPVGIETAAETLDRLADAGRVPDMLIVDLDAAIGLREDSVVRAVWERYGPGIPCALIADTVSDKIEKFADSVGMKVVRRPVHPIELRSALLALRRAPPRGRRR